MKNGRKTLLNPTLTKKLSALLRDGHSIQGACAIAGLGERTFHEWIARGEADSSGQFHAFFVAVTRAREQHKANLIERMVAAAKADWKAAAWLLERHFPKDFAPVASRYPELDGDDKPAAPKINVIMHQDEHSEIARGIMFGDPEAPELMKKFEELRSRLREKEKQRLPKRRLPGADDGEGAEKRGR